MRVKASRGLEEEAHLCSGGEQDGVKTDSFRRTPGDAEAECLRYAS